MGGCVAGQEANHLVLKNNLLKAQEWFIPKCRNLSMCVEETSRGKEGASN